MSVRNPPNTTEVSGSKTSMFFLAKGAGNLRGIRVSLHQGDGFHPKQNSFPQDVSWGKIAGLFVENGENTSKTEVSTELVSNKHLNHLKFGLEPKSEISISKIS